MEMGHLPTWPAPRTERALLPQASVVVTGVLDHNRLA